MTKDIGSWTARLEAYFPDMRGETLFFNVVNGGQAQSEGVILNVAGVH